MKRCPECRRDYYDDTLSFCLEDGTPLVQGSVPVNQATSDDPATAILSEPPALAGGELLGESPTRPQILTTDQTAIFPRGAEAEPRESLGDSSVGQRLSANRTAKPLIGRNKLLAGFGILVILLIAGVFGYRYFTSTESAQINSIAVLPFENRSGSEDTDYLSDGLADSLIFRLSQLPNLKVSPTSSVMRYKGKETDLAQIANELEVDAVMSGRLTQRGDDLSISVQLIDSRTKKLIWAEQYDRKMADLLVTQREIATNIAQKLELKLSGRDTGITKKYTSSNEAYQLYLKGRFYWAKRTKGDILKSIESYKQAIEIDPNFALAYVGIAESYNSMGKNPELPPKDSIPFAKAAAGRALEIDPELAEAHSAMGDSLAIYDWNWKESESHFTRALELDPNIAYIHLAYAGSYLSAVGQTEKSVAEAERAVEIEPLSLINNTVLVTSYIHDRQFEKGLQQGRKAFDLDPNFPLARFFLCFAYIANGKYDEAIALSTEGEQRFASNWAFTAIKGYALAKAGRRAEAELLIAKLNEIAKTQYVRTYYIAWIYTALGDKDKAFGELDKSIIDRDCYLGRVSVDPFMDPLREDPRFKAMLKQMNLPEDKN